MSDVILRVRRLHSDALLPRRMTAGSAGFDLFADGDATVGPGEVVTIACGFAIALPNGFEAQIRPRSGLATRHAVVPVNSPGTIDSDYRGEVSVPLINLGREPFAVRRGDRIAQMIVHRLPTVAVEEVDQLDPTDRGEGGFGHTGR